MFSPRAPVSALLPVGIWYQNDVVLTSRRHHHVASTLIRRNFYVICPLGFIYLVNTRASVQRLPNVVLTSVTHDLDNGVDVVITSRVHWVVTSFYQTRNNKYSV